jgi:hypothetical protein
MENDYVEPKNDSGSVWGTLACTMACAVLLLLLAGIAVGFDPDSISTRTHLSRCQARAFLVGLQPE